MGKGSGFSNTRKGTRGAAEVVCLCVLCDAAGDDTCGWMNVLCNAVAASHTARTVVDSRSSESWDNELEQRRSLAPDMVIMNQRVIVELVYSSFNIPQPC